MKLDSEYDALRAEVLQTFSEQSSLTYVTSISSAVAIWAMYKAAIPIGLGVALWQLILIGICGKLRANYNRIYRLCTYIKVVHEQKLIETYIPNRDEIGWITRSRFIGSTPNKHWTWASGPKFDSAFIRLLSLGIIAFSIISLGSQIYRSTQDIIYVILNCFLFSFILYYTHLISNESKIAVWFEKELFRNYGNISVVNKEENAKD